MTPRDEVQIRKKLLADCRRPGFARLARYQKPADDGSGEIVTRASVKFVESALARWGGISTEIRITDDTQTARRALVIMADTETSIKFSKEILIDKTIERQKLARGENPTGTRSTPMGPVFLVRATEEDMLGKEAIQTSVVVRQLGLKILPADLVSECMEVVAATLDEAAHDEKPTEADLAGKKNQPEETRSAALAGILKHRQGKHPANAAASQQRPDKTGKNRNKKARAKQ